MRDSVDGRPSLVWCFHCPTVRFGAFGWGGARFEEFFVPSLGNSAGWFSAWMLPTINPEEPFSSGSCEAMGAPSAKPSRLFTRSPPVDEKLERQVSTYYRVTDQWLLHRRPDGPGRPALAGGSAGWFAGFSRNNCQPKRRIKALTTTRNSARTKWFPFHNATRVPATEPMT